MKRFVLFFGLMVLSSLAMAQSQSVKDTEGLKTIDKVEQNLMSTSKADAVKPTPSLSGQTANTVVSTPTRTTSNREFSTISVSVSKERPEVRSRAVDADGNEVTTRP